MEEEKKQPSLGARCWREVDKSFSCCLCGKKKPLKEYFVTPEKIISTKDGEGVHHTFFCRGCIETLAKEICMNDPDRNKFKALYRICALAGLYYSDRLAHETIDDCTEEEAQSGVWATQYLDACLAKEEFKNRPFWGSDNVVFAEVLKAQQADKEGDWLTEKDRRNRRAVIACFHYDPIANEPIEERPKLYEDLLTMIEEGMESDLVRQRAALEIVLAFNRISKTNEMLSALQRTPADILEHSEEIKALMAQKKADTAVISAFSKDNGFTERYAVSKSKGTGTLSAIVRDMQDYGYDFGIANKFDIETVQAMRQVAEISAESIFKQVGFSAVDYADMVKEQAQIIRDMQATMDQQAEELRLLREKHLKEELMEELRQELLDKEIDPIEVDELVAQELTYKTGIDFDEEPVFFDGNREEGEEVVENTEVKEDREDKMSETALESE